MPQEANTTRFGGISQNRMKCFSRGLSLGTKYQAKGAEDSESSDDVDEKEDEGKNIRNRHSSRSGSQVYTYTYQCHFIILFLTNQYLITVMLIYFYNYP